MPLNVKYFSEVLIRYYYVSLKPTMKKQKPDPGEEHVRRVRRICTSLRETTEKLSHGEPTFFVRKKVFTMFANNHHKLPKEPA